MRDMSAYRTPLLYVRKIGGPLFLVSIGPPSQSNATRRRVEIGHRIPTSTTGGPGSNAGADGHAIRCMSSAYGEPFLLILVASAESFWPPSRTSFATGAVPCALRTVSGDANFLAMVALLSAPVLPRSRARADRMGIVEASMRIAICP